ncbi:MAG: GyrI-like domain-containing protein [Cytophagaceae bacterium]
MEYHSRINKVFQYIEENPDAELSLDKISEIACYSPFHFHRVFKFITGETLNEYITRQRIEKAALVLLHNNISISELSHQYGFTDNSSFTKAFKKFYGVSPKEFKIQNPNRFTKIRQINSKNGQEYPEVEDYFSIINNLNIWNKMNAKIEVKEMPEMNLAYVSCIGAHNLANAFGKIMQWAGPNGLMNENTRMVTIYHDSFKVTQADKVRMSACIVLNKPASTAGEIGVTSIKKGKFIVGNYVIGLDEFEKSWAGLFLWMNENGYKKAEGNPFEIYYNNFNEHPEKKAIVDFCIPII